MRTALINFAIYTAIFLVVGGIIYFFAFFRPNSNRVAQLNRDIAAANAELVMAAQSEGIIPQLRSDIERLGHELEQIQRTWDNVSQEWHNSHLQFLPEVFDEMDITERINRIVAPFSHSLHIYFQYSRPFGTMSYSSPYSLPEMIWLTPVTVSFIAAYGNIIEILSGFAHEWIDNRIVEFTLNRFGDEWEVVMRLDVLTQTPHPYRHNGYFNVEPSG